MDPQPKSSSANNEVLDQALSSITKGWSMFSLAASKIASTAGENAAKFGEIATQKAAELGGSVSDKVLYQDSNLGTLCLMLQPCVCVCTQVSEIRTKGLKDGLSGIVTSASAFSLSRTVGGTYGGHEAIPEYEASERSSFKHTRSST